MRKKSEKREEWEIENSKWKKEWKERRIRDRKKNEKKEWKERRIRDRK